MKTICPYCGKQQDSSNKVCQFCGAPFPSTEEEAPGKEKEAATALCNMCMRSFPVGELTENEGKLICRECLKKVRKRETSFGPVLKKPPEEEQPARPGRKLLLVLLVGGIFIAGAAVGAYFTWRMIGTQKKRLTERAAELFAPIIEKNNKSVALLHQYKTEKGLAGEAVTLLAEALAATSSDEIKAVSDADAGFARYRSGVKELLRKRISAARTLAGESKDGDPPDEKAALDDIAETDKNAAAVVAALVRRLRLWNIPADAFLIF